MANNVEILLCYFGLNESLTEITITLLSDEKSKNINYNLYMLGCVTHLEFFCEEKMTGFKTGLYEVITSPTGFEVRCSISHKVYKTLTHSYQN